MKAQCIQAVSQAVGRSITVAESRNIEQRVRDAMLAIARQDVARWQTLSQAQRLTEGAQRAAQELVAEAQLKKQRLALTIMAHDRVENYVAAQVAAGHDKTPIDALQRLVSGEGDGRNNTTSAEANVKAIAATTMSKLVDTWDAISPRMLGLLADRKAEEAFIRALYGDKANVPPELVRAVEAWTEATDALRQRFNAAGGDVGKLDNWGLPQSWNQDVAVKLGKQAFVDEFMGWVDRSIYVKPDGTPFNDAEMRDFLGEAWVTIATNGANKPIQPGQSGPGGAIKANRNNQARQIHLKDPDAAVAALQRWSGRSVFEAMSGHVATMARDISLVEQFGPNADLAVSHFIDRYTAEAAKADPTKIGEIETSARRMADLYNHVAGNNPPPARRWLANGMAALRAWMTSAKLGTAAITSFTDEGTLYITSKVNNLPLFKTFMNEVRAFNPLDQAEKRRAMRAGLLVNTMLDDIDRFGTETMGTDIPQRVASTVLRASGLNAMTEARRRAFSVTMLDTIGQLTRDFDDVTKLDPDDWRILRSKGITAEEWAIWRAAQPDDWGQGYTVLTPERIYAVPDVEVARAMPGVDPKLAKERAASKLLAVVIEERDFAVIEPGARERTLLTAGTARGTVPGELIRSVLQFKSFPIAMIMRHWGRALSLYKDTPSKVGYLAALVATQTIMGAVAMQVNEILSGRNPRNMNPVEGEHGAKNILAAVLKGGALSLYGDFLFADTNTYGRTLAAALGGPMLGLVEDSFKLTVGNLQQAAAGEETDFGAEAARFARGYTPGANLWYTKAATDRLIFFQMQELANPGYLRRMQANQQAFNGATYWWDPARPDRVEPVDVAQAVGE
jgi:hypothetical protein